nr:MAG TPA: hypothetical protein [Caudoviricetes sp.]
MLSHWELVSLDLISGTTTLVTITDSRPITATTTCVMSISTAFHLLSRSHTFCPLPIPDGAAKALLFEIVGGFLGFGCGRKFAHAHHARARRTGQEAEIPLVRNLLLEVLRRRCGREGPTLHGVGQLAFLGLAVEFGDDGRVVLVGDVSVDVARDAVYLAAAGVLPDAVRVLRGAGAGILCNPFVIGGQLSWVKIAVQEILGAVKHRIVACRLDLVKEGLADVGVNLSAAAGVNALILDVEGNRVTELVRFDRLDNLFGRPSGRLCGGCVAVQVHSDSQPRRQRAADMRPVTGILLERTVVVAPAHTDHRKVDTRRLDPRPVHIRLPAGHINSVLCHYSTSFLNPTERRRPALSKNLSACV